MPYASSNSYWGLAVESTYGTAASISTYTPVDSPKVEPKITWLDDSDFRGSPTMHYDQVPGVRSDTWSGKTFLYTDVFPEVIRSALGSTDTVASVGPSLWTHTIGLLNSPSVGSQPPSYTIQNQSVDALYTLTAGRLVDLSLSFGADAAVEATFSYAANIYTSSSVYANPTESVQHLIPAWNCAASINGASVAVVETGSLDIKRNTAPIFTLGQQGPYNNFAGPIDVTGAFTFVVESGEPWNADALTRAQIPVILQFIDPVTNYYIQFNMSACQLEDPTIDQSKAYVELETKFTACANTTDAVTAGYSPIKAIVRNGISTAY